MVAISKEKVRAHACRRSLHYFLRQAWQEIEPGTKFVNGRHVECLCEHLQAVSSGQIRRLLINVPYRTSKSTIVSTIWPSWDWIDHPWRQFLTIAHKASLTIRDTRKMRILLRSKWYQDKFPIAFSSDQNQKSRFENDSMGCRIACGVKEGITGEGGHIIICDDLHDRDGAMSDVKRKSTIETFNEKILNRLNDPEKGAIVVIGQRLHEGDIFGELLATGGWEHICLPMRYEPEHPHLSRTSLGFRDWRTQKGELLWPERFGEEILAEHEKSLGSYGTAAQLQQNPVPIGGGLFKVQHFTPVESPPTLIRRAVRYWDKAATDSVESLEADFSAGVLVGEGRDGYYYILDVVHGQWSPAERNIRIEETAKIDKARPFNVQLWVEQEPGSGGKESALLTKRELVEYGARAETVSGKGSKIVRALNWQPTAEGGMVRMVRAPWNSAFLKEITMFPLGKRDDQMDAASGAFAKLLLKSNVWAA